MAAALDAALGRAEFGADEPPTLWRQASRPVARLGVALEPWPETGAWAAEHRLDALFLHRPWTLDAEALPAGTGVLALHGPFDERLAIGFHPALAAALGMVDPEPLGEKAGRAIGMVGDVAGAPEAERFLDAVADLFGGCEARVRARAERVRRAAAVGAMTEALVREAAARGADAYVTGQLRAPARDAVAETGIGVAAVGHRRAEEWGLLQLEEMLRERWDNLTVVQAPRLPAKGAGAAEASR